MSADSRAVRAALAHASRVGAYFEVADPAGDAAGGWRPLRELVEDGSVLAERVAFARDFLAQRTGADIELRACASINSLGVVSRLVAPALATACLAGVVPELGVERVAWRPADGGPLPVAFAAPGGRVVDSAAAAATALVELVIEPVARPVLDAYRRCFAVSPQTLWGNLASALNGAAGMLPADTSLDPLDVVAALLERAPLAGAGRYEPFAGRRFFVRENCCLFYRVPAGGKCADCVLVPEAARHDMWRAAAAR
ncbi:Ferric iron reductase protein FhuF, involved in iron transport [Jatrophihabitans endophyticus]|uniref:Ferric iron reductase protein FhuF, involved in iron transport n=1 Tax=Jatrophihabitans endophyticus TaxID=1206085 RepID=A0A1M5Q6Z8_9ACTN|nr:(2Fe-2S)-binding protein [Jatrophihabitans endophyticus]SHH09762.1 Ferric iron reductase protein FhuF, involved in iron transport [Jatrophihabitans endophyticus]